LASELATYEKEREAMYLKFKKMDINNNNFIETDEFDRDSE